MNKLLYGYTLTVEELYAEFIGHISIIERNTTTDWTKEFRREKGRLPSWDELQTRDNTIPDKKELELDYLNKEIGDWIKSERLRNWIISVAEQIEQGKVNYGVLYTELKRLGDSLDFREVIGSDIKDRYEEVIEHASIMDEQQRIHTGIKSLDKLLDGGWGKGEIAVYIAPPGWGKTMLLCNGIYAGITHRKSCLLLSFELSEERLLERIYRRIVKVGREEIRRDKEKVKEKLKKYFRMVKGAAKIVYKRPYSWGVDDIGVYIDRLRNRGEQVDIVYIDYLDKLRVKKGELRLALREMTEELRYLSIEKKVAIVTATQANRASLTATIVTEEHVGESFGKVEVADIVLSLSRNQKDEEKGQGKITLLKNRDRGGKGVILPVRLNYDKVLVEGLEV